MGQGPRWSVERYEAYKRHRQLRDIGAPRELAPPIVGVANAQDVPTLTDVVVPGKGSPKGKTRPSKVPYYQQLTALLRERGIPAPIPEFKFHPQRKFRFDFCWVEQKLALEIDGAIWQQGGGAHSHPIGILRDMEKGNLAAIAGFRVLRFQPDQVAEAADAVATIFAEPWR